MVSLNAEILKDVIVQVDIADLKVSVLYPPLPELIQFDNLQEIGEQKIIEYCSPRSCDNIEMNNTVSLGMTIFFQTG